MSKWHSPSPPRLGTVACTPDGCCHDDDSNGDSWSQSAAITGSSSDRQPFFIIWAHTAWACVCLNSQVSVVWSFWTVQGNSLYSDCYTRLNNVLIHIQSLDLWKTQTEPVLFLHKEIAFFGIKMKVLACRRVVSRIIRVDHTIGDY